MVLKLPFGKHLECNLCDKDCYYKQLKRLKKENEELKTLFNDDYFKGLDNKTVIELAKKSIRITAYNRELENKLEKIKEIAEVILFETNDIKQRIRYKDVFKNILEIIEEK